MLRIIFSIMNIENDGIIYFIKKNKGEVSNIYYDRVNMIVKDSPKTEQNIHELKRKYELLCNKKFLKCEY